MNRIFVDSGHYVALLNTRDQLHETSAEAATRFRHHPLVTTEEVLTEVLNFYCEQGQHFRKQVAEYVRLVLLDVRIEIVEHRPETFLDALDLYESRLDKGYSLTGCISMNVCREMEIVEVLTNDNHFRQEGFSVLLA